MKVRQGCIVYFHSPITKSVVKAKVAGLVKMDGRQYSCLEPLCCIKDDGTEFCTFLSAPVVPPEELFSSPQEIFARREAVR